MPIIAKSTFNPMQSSSGGGSSNFSDPNSVWRNSVNVRHINEFALVEFITDLQFGDISHFHPIPATAERSGKAFTQYVYCTNKNATQEEGRVIDEPCPHCESADQQIVRTRDRYRYWVLLYGIYHAEANPDIQAQREWTQDWKQVQVGQQTYFRETVLKPQILELAPTTWAFLSDHAKRKGTIKNGLFEYTKAMSEGRINYRLLGSDLSVPDFSNQMAEHADALPSLQDIAAGLITEVNVPQFTTDKTARTKVEEADAFEKMANITEGEEF